MRLRLRTMHGDPQPKSPPDGLPDRRLPLLYFIFAYLCLLWAFAIMALQPRVVAGFFYHPKLIAVVHLFTLGWISASILGAIYLISPMALRIPLEARRLDLWAFASYGIGTVGMASHFWIEEPLGMVSAALLVALGLLRVGWRLLTALRSAPLPPEVKLHFYLAFCNLTLAVTLGLLIGIDKWREILPGYVLHHVLGHAHLAIFGWATLMVMAAGYRLLPMLLPAAMPRGPILWAGALLMETGVLGLAAALWTGSRWAAGFGLLVLAGIGVFLGRVRWMLRHRRPPPRALRRPDFGVLQALVALACLAGAALLGAVLLLAPPAAWKLRAAMAYGVLVLVGFLSQIVVGVSARLLPLAAWLWAYPGRSFAARPPSPHVTPIRALQLAVFFLWLVGVPLLAVALAFDRPGLVCWAAATLLAGTALALLQQITVLRRTFRPAPAESKSGPRPQV